MLLGIDQVLLDLVVEVDADLDLYERYGLEPNSQCLAEARHDPLLSNLLRRANGDVVEEGAAAASPVTSSPGGVIPNSLRGAAWWLRQQPPLPKPPALTMLGRVGCDKAGERLRTELAAAGVDPAFEVASAPAEGSAESGCLEDHTGLCCCLLLSKERTMVTKLGAGRAISSLAERVVRATGGSAAGLPRLIIVSAFYAQADVDGFAAVLAWLDQCGEDRPLLVLALGAQWCTGVPIVQATARLADFLFGNEGEIEAMAGALSAGSSTTNFDEAMEAIAAWKSRGWVVGTCGPKCVGARHASAPSQALQVPVTPLDKSKFVDDIGAGDSFMGAFLVTVWQKLADRAEKEPPGQKTGEEQQPPAKAAKVQFVSDSLSHADIEAACRAGIATAAAVLQCPGAQFPAKLP